MKFCSSWKAASLEILFKGQELHKQISENCSLTWLMGSSVKLSLFFFPPLSSYFPLELGLTDFHCRVITYSALPSLSVAFVSLSGIAFTKDGRYMAVAERRDCKDFISLFVCSDWQLLRVRHVPVFHGFCTDYSYLLYTTLNAATWVVWF